ncbi:carbonic anhydrase 2 [Hermetia illucens]|uniref:carbonic anhydrase 2 n=1 Tax=Hermetia illucens TaxID=343691 RepID=UPI0018CC72EF|nr:carbonic anhydrase 2 [Hermetia illucens]XP_037919861.1 carbonic anhydrase 2 [Hermetia illucens]XP_037919862.1 carbonic anhydrase 2 [Hermetia illucens]XP_037919863.1 carbonic anhydrase 2 [Hermetia illucens]XP_037919864.1 carbonic anhydrase 2 [Hermetia illucens]XP_037919865.1 carbonic anhydrase 2 [Hermetia illucens]
MPVQSPISISNREIDHKDDVEPLEYHGHWEPIGIARVQNTGTSAVVTFAKRKEQPFIIGGPLKNKYIFEQLHFHWAETDESGCEHTLEGITYAMEAHAVHYNSKYSNFNEAKNKPDGLAVVAFFIQACGEKDCPEFKKITEGIHIVEKPNTSASLDSDCLSWIGLQELSKHYYTYKGSLTTAPYFESVTWIIYRTPIYVSKGQVATFRNLQSCPKDANKKIVNNFREIQVPPTKPEVIFARNVVKPKSKL